MSFARVNGIQLHYSIHGDSGEPLVLVHGYTGDTSDWHHQVPEFSRVFRVLVLDLRGHGQSESPEDRSVYTIPQMALDVEALAKYVGFDRYHLVGHSMGGGIAQEIALRSPHKLLSLTLHDTSCQFALLANHESVEWWKRSLHLAGTRGMAAVAREEPLTPPPPHMPPERISETRERLSHMSVYGYVGGLRGLIDWEGTEHRASNIGTPTLIVYGELDSPMIRTGSATLAQFIPGSTVEVIPEAGHSPQWERPALFNAALLRFLQECATKT